MTCQEARALFSEHLDSRLSEAAAVEVSGHLNFCGDCSRELELLRGIGRLLREAPQAPLPAGFLARLSARRRAETPMWPFPEFFPTRQAAFAATVVLVGVVIFRASRPAPPLNHPSGPPLAEAPPAPEPRTRPAPFRDSGKPFGAGPEAAAPVVTGLEPPPSAKLTPGGAPAFTKAEPGFDNKAQAARMQAESEELGIKGVGADGGSRPEDSSPEPFLGRHLGTPEVKKRADASVSQLVALRRAIEDSIGRPKPVAIAGRTAPVLAQADEANGSALGEAAGLWQGDFSGGNEGTRTVEDEKAWRALWKSLHAAGPAPEVDFSRQEVVAVFLGERPTGGFAVQIAAVESTESAVTVRYRELSPAPGLPAPEGTTTPYALRAIPKTDLPVRFEKQK